MHKNVNDVCRFCLKLVNETDFEIIDEVTKKLLDELSIKVDLNVSEDPLMCPTCSKVLNESFSFQSKCLYMDGIINVPVEDNVKVSLMEFYLRERENKCSIDIDGDHKICRLCIKPVLNDNFIALNNADMKTSLIKDMIKNYLPDTDLALSDDPIICEACHMLLQNYSAFATNCLDVEEKIQQYCVVHGSNSKGQVQLSCVRQFGENKAMNFESIFIRDLVIKQEEPCFVPIKEEKVWVPSEDWSDLKVNVDAELSLKQEKAKRTEDDQGSTTGNNTLQGKESTHMNKVEGCNSISQRKHLCHICNSTFKTKKTLYQHMPLHKRTSGIQMYVCDKCSFKTRYKMNLKKHRMTHTGDPLELILLKCEFCPYKTNLQVNLKSHLINHKDLSERRKYKCTDCPRKFVSNRNLQLHMLSHKDDSEVIWYRCANCSFKTKIKENLCNHQITHKNKSELSTFHCVQCPYEAKTKRYLKEHMSTHENHVYTCTLCNFATKSRRYFKRHTILHKDKTEIQIYSCDKCTYETRFKFGLTEHNKIHSDVKEYKCDICLFETSYRSRLKTHLLSHKDLNEVTTYKCNQCSYQSKFKNTLRRHLQTHTNTTYECGSCGTAYKTKSYMIKHESMCAKNLKSDHGDDKTI